MKYCENEVKLHRCFKQLIIEKDPDIFTGHNIVGFDWNAFFTRCRVLDCEDALDFSRLKGNFCTLEENNFRSKQVVNMKRFSLDCPGRITMDFQVWVERNLPPNKYENYRLNTIAQKELKEGKDDVTPADIFRAYETQDSVQLGTIARYCVMDSLLVDRLVNKLNAVYQTLAMAKTANVPISYLFDRGQTVKVSAMQTAEGYQHGMLQKWTPMAELDIILIGAVVLELITGIHSDPSGCMDFNSLYPSIMITHSICPSSLVREPKYDNLDKVTYETIQWQQTQFTLNTKKESQTFDDVDKAIDCYVKSVDTVKSNFRELLTIKTKILEKLVKIYPSIATLTVADGSEDTAELSLLDFMERLSKIPTKDVIYSLGRIIATLRVYRSNVVQNADLMSLNQSSTQLQDVIDALDRLVRKLRANHIAETRRFKQYFQLNNDETEDSDDECNLQRTRPSAPSSSPLGSWKTESKTMSFKFASNRKSILKILLQRVLVQRKQVRQKQKAYKKTDFQYHVLEGQQLALKVTANSVYGAIALKDPCIGACITAKGREMLQKVKYEAEVNFSTYLQSLTWTQRDVDDKIPSAIMGEPVCSQPLRIQAIGGDTDSVFIKFHGATINQAISWCMKGSDYFSSFFADTIKMEYEKVWCPYIAIAKKKGVGKEYTHDDTKYEITYKGMETKRRNYCAFLKETLLEVIQIVIHDAEKGPHKAVAYVDDQLYVYLLCSYLRR